MTKIEFLMKALENNNNSLSFFDGCCDICPLYAECMKASEAETPDNFTACEDFLDQMLEG